MKKRHVNIPIFIPHLGCPNQCVFCNQRIISGVEDFEAESVVKIIEDSLSTVKSTDDVEIAFFGGSFTGIERSLMCNLLKIAYSYIERGLVSSIRCSTRPDYIDEEILAILKKYGVKTIELGLQSFDSEVLLKTKRGHTAEDEIRACKMIVDNGFDLVGQMMIGLPGSTLDSELKTAKFIVDSGAVGARIYPTVVFTQTELCQMALLGVYEPLTLDDAIIRSERVLRVFLDAGVDVIRIGLCASENLTSSSTCYAGPNHPSLGELVENELYYNLIKERIEDIATDSFSGKVVVLVSRGALSKAIGQRKRNKFRLVNELNLISLSFSESDELNGYDILIRQEERTDKCT